MVTPNSSALTQKEPNSSCTAASTGPPWPAPGAGSPVTSDALAKAAARSSRIVSTPSAFSPSATYSRPCPSRSASRTSSARLPAPRTHPAGQVRRKGAGAEVGETSAAKETRGSWA
nr:hypothetical protein GCM10020093_097190 [Planobispora longispora]